MAFNYNSPTRKGSPEYEEKPVHGINRFGLHGIAGEMVRDGPDPVTVQILEQVNFFPRKIGTTTKKTGFDLRPQESLLPKTASSKYGGSTTSGLGLAGINFCPLKLNRVYGRDGKLPVLNLTGAHKNHILYAASNVVVFFDFLSNTQSVLQGHKHKISCIASDSEFRYIATGESESDPMVIIWDVRTGFPLQKISPGTADFRGVVSIGFVYGYPSIGFLHRTERKRTTLKEDGAEHHEVIFEQSVSIWHFERDDQHHHHSYNKAQAIVEIPKKAKQQSEIIFSRDAPHHFITTGEAYVVFYTWLRRDRTIIFHIPTGHRNYVRRIKTFTTSIWINDSVLTATSSGYLVEWKLRQPLGLEDSPNPQHNVKEFRRFIKVDESVGLTALVYHKGFLLVGDDNGTVRFLDMKFRLLRWTKTEKVHPIKSIAFNLIDTLPDWKLDLRSTYEYEGYDHPTYHRFGYSAVSDYSYGGSKFRTLSETTLERGPLHKPEECLDIVIGYFDGTVSYFHISEEKVDTLLPETLGPEPIVAMDSSPVSPHFAISTVHGSVQFYDYQKNEILISQKIFKKLTHVTTLKFHPTGAFFVIGTRKGTLYFRKSFTLGLMDKPLHACDGAVCRIVFSSCGTYIGVSDDEMTVTLCHYSPDLSSWEIRGRHQSHYRQIVDITFFTDTKLETERFFSVGQDRRIVEYDVYSSTIATGLKIISATFVEQMNLPTSMVFDDVFPDHGPVLLYANTNNKIRVFDQDACKVRKTCQGPEYGSPISRMTLVYSDIDRTGEAKFIVMVLGTKIGLMKTPVDGNPFKYMAVRGHPHNIHDIGIGNGGREIFTYAHKDPCIFMWLPELTVLENCSLSGGAGVMPFKRYLEAGRQSDTSICEDIENAFYHLMMKRAENQKDLLTMPLKIPVTEIPTVFRTFGYFPSELDIDMILEEVEFLLGVKYGERLEEIGIDDFIILFANHKDGGAHDDEVTRAFEILGERNEFDELCIPKEIFVNLLTMKGETLNELDLPLFLPTFYKPVYRNGMSKAESIRTHLPALSSTFRTDSHLSERNKSETSFEQSLGSRASTNSKQSSQNSVHDEKIRMHVLNKPMAGFSRFSQFPEDEYDDWEPTLEIPNDITLSFFLQELLPGDVTDGLNLERNEFVDDMLDLEKISEEHPAGKPYNEVVKRWKGRDEWRYFKRIFEQVKNDKVPLDIRLKAVMEMDLYCRTGKLRDSAHILKGEDMGEEPESQLSVYFNAGSLTSLKKKKKSNLSVGLKLKTTFSEDVRKSSLEPTTTTNPEAPAQYKERTSSEKEIEVEADIEQDWRENKSSSSSNKSMNFGSNKTTSSGLASSSPHEDDTEAETERMEKAGSHSMLQLLDTADRTEKDSGRHHSNVSDDMPDLTSHLEDSN